MATFSRLIKDSSVAKINDYAVAKQPAKVISQNPKAGTPVLQGMTIELHAVSLSDVPYYVVDEQQIQAIKNVPVAEIQKVIEGDPRIKAAVKNGQIPEADRGYVLQQLNAGLKDNGMSGELSGDDAERLVQGFGDLGIIDF